MISETLTHFRTKQQQQKMRHHLCIPNLNDLSADTAVQVPARLALRAVLFPQQYKLFQENYTPKH